MKRKTRKISQDIRNSIPRSEKKALDKTIEANLYGCEFFYKARYIFCYVSFNSEIDTFPIIKNLLKLGKTVTVPKINSKNHEMKAYVIDDITRCLEYGKYDILEPKSICKEADYSKIDLIIVPGLVFTLEGHRLGYGGGFYDRFLEQYKKPITCALAYNRLIFDDIPVNEKDLPVDYIITESFIEITKRGKIDRKH